MIPKQINDPTSIEMATRIPMIAPAATIINEPSMPIVYLVSMSRPNADGQNGNSVGKANAASD